MKEEKSELKNEIQRGNKASEATDLVKIASLDDYVSTSNLEIDGERHMMVENLNLKYGTAQALYNVSVPIQKLSLIHI